MEHVKPIIKNIFVILIIIPIMFLSEEKQKKQIISWSLYDFANQPYTNLIITFIYSAFFVNYIAGDEQQGTFLWANAISITASIA